MTKTHQTPTGWAPDSWKNHEALQQPTYPDQAALDQALAQLKTLPPLVTSWEIFSLKKLIADAQQGKRFVLQGGDCAERFADCQSGLISNRLKVLLQMSMVMVFGMRKPVVRIGRFAGQYAKPRSKDLETRDGVTLPSYRGDLINAPAFDEASRVPNPQRMIDGHAHSAMTLNFVRALIDGGFADLRHPEYWNLAWMDESPLQAEYQSLVEELGRGIDFMESVLGTELPELDRVSFFTSHEALLLPYEEALTRQVPRQQGYFNLSTHLPWIGMRTAMGDSAHVEMLRGIRNPVGVKVGPSVAPSDLMRVIDALNPNDEAGRLVLIHRMGADKVSDRLLPLLETVKREGRTVLWTSDPMHGNTESTESGIKTRRFGRIHRELETAFDVHQAAGTILGGVHLELTGEDVTECLGGARDLNEADLGRAYHTQVDPRLNYEQALELALLIVKKFKQTS